MPHYTSPVWDKATVAALTALWQAGRSSGQIAAELGLSRSAVMGKVSRLRDLGVDFSTRPAPVRPGPDPNSDRQKRLQARKEREEARKSLAKPHGRDKGQVRRYVTLAHKPVAPPPEPEPVVSPGTNPIALFAAGPFRCKRPLWGDAPTVERELRLVCGAPAVEGRSYCPACLARMTQPLTTNHARLARLAARQ